MSSTGVCGAATTGAATGVDTTGGAATTGEVMGAAASGEFGVDGSAANTSIGYSARAPDRPMVVSNCRVFISASLNKQHLGQPRKLSGPTGPMVHLDSLSRSA